MGGVISQSGGTNLLFDLIVAEDSMEMTRNGWSLAPLDPPLEKKTATTFFKKADNESRCT